MSKNIVRLAREFVVKIHGMVLARCTDFSATFGKNTIDITSFDTEGFEDFVADRKNWSISFGSMVTRDYGVGSAHAATGLGSGTFNELFDLWLSATGDYPVTVCLGDDSSEAPTGHWFEGGGIITELSIDGSVGESMTYSGTIQGAGEIKRTKA